MKGIDNLTRWILSICLLLGGCIHINLFSIIYILLFLSIPWAFIHSSTLRLRFFFILSLITLMTSSLFLLSMISLQIFSLTNKGRTLFSIQCSLNVRILHYFGFILWTYSTNKFIFVLTLFTHGMIVCKKIDSFLEKYINSRFFS
jgi:hypothetical protein